MPPNTTTSSQYLRGNTDAPSRRDFGDAGIGGECLPQASSLAPLQHPPSPRLPASLGTLSARCPKRLLGTAEFSLPSPAAAFDKSVPRYIRALADSVTLMELSQVQLAAFGSAAGPYDAIHFCQTLPVRDTASCRRVGHRAGGSYTAVRACRQLLTKKAGKGPARASPRRSRLQSMQKTACCFTAAHQVGAGRSAGQTLHFSEPFCLQGRLRSWRWTAALLAVP